MKDTDIHENIEAVDLNLLLEHIVEPYQACDQTRVTLDGRALATTLASRWHSSAASATCWTTP